GHFESDGLSLFQGELIGDELEPPGRDRHDARTFVGACSCDPEDGDDRGPDSGLPESSKSAHRDSPSLRICWMPTVPEYSRSVSSTSWILAFPEASATSRTPRFWKGFALSKGNGFFGTPAAGSGNAKMSERAA